MNWLPNKPAEALDKVRESLARDGFTTTRVELVCALVLDCNPEDASLAEGLRAYKAQHRQIRPPREQLRGVPLMLRMPSPITLRLDLLVSFLSDRGPRIYRHELIGTLVTRASKDLPQVELACRRYRKAKARAAAVPGFKLKQVLAQERPRPGARSL